MSGDEYMALLLERQAEHVAEHPHAPGYPPLLAWFIQPGDEDLFTPPEGEITPEKRPTKGRTHRTAASLRDERDRLQTRLDRLGKPMSDDPATARVGARLAHRNAARMDRELEQAVRLSERIKALEWRIARAEVRER